MQIYQILFGLVALSVPTIGLIVMVRLLWSAYQALCASRLKLAALSVLAIACLVALCIAVATVWFGYAVAHTKKDLRSDLTVILLTVLPFYVASYALWRMAKYLQSVLGRHARQPDVPAGAPQAPRR
jgi:hypothetical protein